MKQKVFTTAVLAVEGIGRLTYYKIVNQLTKEQASFNDFWKNKANIWQVCGLNKLQQAGLLSFKKKFTPESYFGWVKSQGIKLIIPEDNNYPKWLKEIDDRPLVLYVKGELKSCKNRPIAVVGTRKVTGYGRLVCKKIVTELIAYGATIVSGFMYGVDTYAHQIAVNNQAPTVGVLGFGFHHMYPQENKSLFNQMLMSGNAFITEYPPWRRGNRGSFRERNRIVAGMSRAVVVIEAGVRSGTQITAGFAGDFGRGLCAVAGPITNPYCEGTKALVNLGARLVSSGQEVLEEAQIINFTDQAVLGSKKGSKNDRHTNGISLECLIKKFELLLHRQIIKQVFFQPLTTSDLALATNTSIAKLNTQLSLLELEGWLRQEGGVWYVNSKIYS
jgi:DNA processing protein